MCRLARHARHVTGIQHMPGNASTMRVLRTLAFGASLDPFHLRNPFYQYITSPIHHTRVTAASCSLPAVVFTHRSRALSPCLLPGRGTDPPRPPHTLSTFLLCPVHLAVPVHVRHYVRQYGPAGLVASRQDSAGYGPTHRTTLCHRATRAVDNSDSPVWGRPR